MSDKRQVPFTAVITVNGWDERTGGSGEFATVGVTLEWLRLVAATVGAQIQEASGCVVNVRVDFSQRDSVPVERP